MKAKLLGLLRRVASSSSRRVQGVHEEDGSDSLVSATSLSAELNGNGEAQPDLNKQVAALQAQVDELLVELQAYKGVPGQQHAPPETSDLEHREPPSVAPVPALAAQPVQRAHSASRARSARSSVEWSAQVRAAFAEDDAAQRSKDHLDAGAAGAACATGAAGAQQDGQQGLQPLPSLDAAVECAGRTPTVISWEALSQEVAGSSRAVAVLRVWDADLSAAKDAGLDCTDQEWTHQRDMVTVPARAALQATRGMRLLRLKTEACYLRFHVVLATPGAYTAVRADTAEGFLERMESDFNQDIKLLVAVHDLVRQLVKTGQPNVMAHMLSSALVESCTHNCKTPCTARLTAVAISNSAGDTFPSLVVEFDRPMPPSHLCERLLLPQLVTNMLDAIVTIFALNGRVLYQNRASVEYMGFLKGVMEEGYALSDSNNRLRQLFSLEAGKLEELLDATAEGEDWTGVVQMHRNMVSMARGGTVSLTSTLASAASGQPDTAGAAAVSCAAVEAMAMTLAAPANFTMDTDSSSSRRGSLSLQRRGLAGPHGNRRPPSRLSCASSLRSLAKSNPCSQRDLSGMSPSSPSADVPRSLSSRRQDGPAAAAQQFVASCDSSTMPSHPALHLPLAAIASTDTKHDDDDHHDEVVVPEATAAPPTEQQARAGLHRALAGIVDGASAAPVHSSTDGCSRDTSSGGQSDSRLLPVGMVEGGDDSSTRLRSAVPSQNGTASAYTNTLKRSVTSARRAGTDADIEALLLSIDDVELRPGGNGDDTPRSTSGGGAEQEAPPAAAPAAHSFSMPRVAGLGRGPPVRSVTSESVEQQAKTAVPQDLDTKRSRLRRLVSVLLPPGAPGSQAGSKVQGARPPPASLAAAPGGRDNAAVNAAALAAKGTAEQPNRDAPSADVRWFEVMARVAMHPTTKAACVVIIMEDVSSQVKLEEHLAQVLEAEHQLLTEVFPRHIIQHMTSARQEKQQEAARQLARSPTGVQGQAKLSLLSQIKDPCSVATWHSAVTVLFADIVGFTSMCKQVAPVQVMQFLNELYVRLDGLLDIFGVYKVETIGDCYMVAGGLMTRDADGFSTVRSDEPDPLHATRVVSFAKAMLREARKVVLPTDGLPVRMRVGIHSGPVVSGVVGQRMPRFCLFGDTINTASRMESTSHPGKIQISEDTHTCLKDHSEWNATGGVEVKGKGMLRTFLWSGSNTLQHSHSITSHEAQTEVAPIRNLMSKVRRPSLITLGTVPPNGRMLKQ